MPARSASWSTGSASATRACAPDGTVVVHSDEPGYRSILRLSAAATEVVGTYVHVISDDTVDASAIASL